MGATLPILVEYIYRFVGHTARGTGWLYASNTFGAAVAAYMVVRVFFVQGGLSSTIDIAAGLNVATALLAFVLYHKKRDDTQPLNEQSSPAPGKVAWQPSEKKLLVIGFALGYISLSQELIWYRVLGFITANKPQIFALLLCAFLSGIAVASVTVGRLYSDKRNIGFYIFYTLLLMLSVWFSSLPLIAYAASHYNRVAGINTGLTLAALTA